MKTDRLKWMEGFMALTIIAFGQGSAATLTVGDPAPKLQVSKWVQGDPVKEFQRDKVYLVEFWATWCGPCLTSIPHVNELHTRFKDKGLIVIGQDVLEQDPDAVQPFIKKMADKMMYRVALDTEEGKMAQTWMEAAGEDGIPTAFVVDKRGTIVWIGHPMKLQESFLQQVIDGSLDVGKAVAAHEQRKMDEEQQRFLWGAFNRHRQKEEWDQAESVLAEIEKLLPETERDRLGMTRFGFLLDRKNYKAAYKVAAQLSDAHPDDAMMQNSIAWTIATKEGVTERDLPLAEKIARRANAAAQSNFDKAEILDTLARVLFLKGEHKLAIELQEKAVQFATGGRKDQFQNNLDDYKAGRVPNEARLRSLAGEVSRSIQKHEWSKAESALAELEKAFPNGDRVQIDSYRFSILAGRGDYDGAVKIASRLAQAPEEKAMMLNSLAWSIAIRGGATAPELDLAEKIARGANEATKGSNAEILDTLARVLFLKGQKESAVELQEKAVSFAKGHRKTQFQETLDSYKKDTLPKSY
jgi:thiol-disulfide isomerase/thioredoxin